MVKKYGENGALQRADESFQKRGFRQAAIWGWVMVGSVALTTIFGAMLAWTYITGSRARRLLIIPASSVVLFLGSTYGLVWIIFSGPRIS